MPGTIFANDDFDPVGVTESLRGAMKGFGTDEDQIISTIVNHNNAQRQEISTAFKAAYGKDLIDELKSELRGDLEDVTIALMTPPRVYDARELHNAISGAGTNESTLIEIMCTRTNDEINEIKEKYKEEFENELEDDLKSDTSGYFERLMVSLCAAGREENTDVDYDRAITDATAFHEAGAGAWGTEEAEMNAILCLRSLPQLRQIIVNYEEFTGTTIEESIKNECSGTLQNGYLAIVQSAKDTPAFFARRLKDCFAGFGTNDNDLIRIIVSRSEIDLADIRDSYESIYEKPLLDAIADECSGDYKNMLQAVVNPQ
ncbi:annexin B9 isoform X2 [Patella vulgata]|uniref:annexin B9 isoform X2 n=1 Tax=Patella vulgata TaxID=6465 RepID=UPI00217FD0D3|nr:annexin B9 isoform X2 [Patella vulgata]